MRAIACLLLGVVLLWGPEAWASSTQKTYRVALLIGHNKGNQQVSALRFAQLDARKMRDLLVQLGGYRAKDIWLLTGQPRAVVLRAMAAIRRRIVQKRKKHKGKLRVVLFVYYSGHAQRGRLLLGQDVLPFARLKAFLKRTPASLRLVVIDACESGKMTASKGLKRRKERFRFPFVRLAPSATGEVIITATGEKENAHEDATLRGGIFTHYFISGLRGAADRNGDGHVTLEEVYTYSYNRALERTILSSRGPQRARFAKKLSGYGSLVLTTLSQQRAWLWLDKNIQGEFFIWNRRRDLLLADVVKGKGRAITVALPPGKYVLQWRRNSGVYHKQIRLQKGQRFRLRQVGKRLAYWRPSPTKGADATGVWRSFQGQLVGTGLSLSYRAGFSGIDGGVLHQGIAAHLLLPLGSSRLGLYIQSGYQFGQQQVNDTLKYGLHLIDLDLGAIWTLLERPHWWLGAGAVWRSVLLIQQLDPRPQQQENTLLSFSFGALGVLSAQFGFAQIWFVQASLLAGIRVLNLGGQWTARWDLNTTLGIGVRL